MYVEVTFVCISRVYVLHVLLSHKLTQPVLEDEYCETSAVNGGGCYAGQEYPEGCFRLSGSGTMVLHGSSLQTMAYSLQRSSSTSLEELERLPPSDSVQHLHNFYQRGMHTIKPI